MSQGEEAQFKDEAMGGRRWGRFGQGGAGQPCRTASRSGSVLRVVLLAAEETLHSARCCAKQ